MAEERWREEAERVQRARAVSEPGGGSGRAGHGSSLWGMWPSHLSVTVPVSQWWYQGPSMQLRDWWGRGGRASWRGRPHRDMTIRLAP